MMVLFLESMLNITLLFPVHAKSNCRNKKCSGVRREELYDCMCNILTSSDYSIAKYYCFVYESLQAHSQVNSGGVICTTPSKRTKTKRNCSEYEKKVNALLIQST